MMFISGRHAAVQNDGRSPPSTPLSDPVAVANRPAPEMRPRNRVPSRAPSRHTPVHRKGSLTDAVLYVLVKKVIALLRALTAQTAR